MPTDTGAGAPGHVYLCQAGSHVSCGACCGLYNVDGVSRDRLSELLAHRTSLFAKTPRDMAGILDFRDHIRDHESPVRPLPAFHHCPYIGLIGPQRTRVGCLLHPLGEGNGGVDFRGLSYYGGMACRIYFCPTYRRVPVRYRRMVLAAADHWYDFGLMITEWRLINGFFGEVENRLGRLLEKRDMENSRRGMQPIRNFLELKSVWRFRGPNARGPVHDFFEKPDYVRPPVDYPAMGKAASRFDIMLRELESAFAGPRELAAAEYHLEELVEQTSAWLR